MFCFSFSFQFHREYITSARAAICKLRKEHRYELNAQHQVINTFVFVLFISKLFWFDLFDLNSHWIFIFNFFFSLFLFFLVSVYSLFICKCKTYKKNRNKTKQNRKSKPQYNMDQKVWKPTKWYVPSSCISLKWH